MFLNFHNFRILVCLAHILLFFKSALVIKGEVPAALGADAHLVIVMANHLATAVLDRAFSSAIPSITLARLFAAHAARSLGDFHDCWIQLSAHND